VVGGGATGVELAGTLAELRRTVLAATFPDVDPAGCASGWSRWRRTCSGRSTPKLREYAKAQLLARGVDVRLDTRIGEVTADQVPAVTARTCPATSRYGRPAWRPARGWPLGLPQGKNGRIVVGPDLRVHGQDRIFAVGDIAVQPGRPRRRSSPSPPSRWDGTPPRRSSGWRATGHRAFKYHDKGIMATIGRRPPWSSCRRPAAAGHARLARVVRPAPALPARRAQPGVHDRST
jgi:NADH dehydrogenase